MTLSASDQKIQALLDRLNAEGYRPEWEFATASGEGYDQLYALPTTPWQRENFGNGSYFAHDPDRYLTNQGLLTGQFGDALAITPEQAASDPRFSKDWGVWQEHLGNLQDPSRDSFSPFGDQFSMALGALAASTGLAGAYGAFAPALAGAEAGAAGAAGAGEAAAAGAGGYAGLGSAGPELLSVYGPAEGLAAAGGGTAGGIGSTLSSIAPYAQWGGRGLNVLGRLTGNDMITKAGSALSTIGGGAESMADWTGSFGDWVGLAGGLAGLGIGAYGAINSAGGADTQSPIDPRVLPQHADTSVWAKDRAINFGEASGTMADQARQANRAGLAWFGNELGYNPIFGDQGELIGYNPTGTPEQRGLEQTTADFLTRQDNQYSIAAAQQAAGLDRMAGQQAATDNELAKADWTSQRGWDVASAQNDVSTWLQNAAAGELNSPQAQATMAGLFNQAELAAALQDPTLARLGVSRGADGAYQNVTGSPEMLNRTLQADLLRRAQAAASGQGEIDPGLQRQLAEEEAAMQARMRASLGADWASSTPGMAAMADFAKRRSEALYNQQQNDMNARVATANSLQGTNLAGIQALGGITDAAVRNYGMANQAQSDRVGQYANIANIGLNASQNLSAAGDRFGRDAANRTQISGAYASERDRLVNMPQNQIQGQARTLADLYGASADLRGQRMAAANKLANQAYQDPGYLSLAQLFGNLSSQSGNLALGLGSQIQQGNLQAYNTDPSTTLWTNFNKNLGSDLGSGAGAFLQSLV